MGNNQMEPNGINTVTPAEVNPEVPELKQFNTVKAQHEQIKSEYRQLSHLAKLAIQNALLLMCGMYGGGFYVKYVQDEGTCYGWLNLIIVYPDGSFKSIQSYKNFLKETDAESSNGVFTPEQDVKVKGYKKVYWEGNEILGNFTSLEQYSTPQMPIPEKALWSKIIENYNKIPIVKITQSASIEQLVAEIQEWAEIHSNEYEQGFLNGKTRCYITKEAFEEIVESNGWYVSKAKSEFDALGIFDKDPSSKGYQKSKRVGNTVKRYYAIKKNMSENLSLPMIVGDVSFDRGFEPQSVRKMRQLEAENSALIAKCNNLAAQTGRADFEI